MALLSPFIPLIAGLLRLRPLKCHSMASSALVCMERALRALCLAALLACLMGKPTAERKDRVHHERPLSDKPHDDDDDFDYDHEAFLGSEDEARTFDQLTPEESKERLGLMVDKIDADHDGLVTEDELREWIKFAQRRWLVEDADKQWNSHDLDVDGHISWDEYKNVTYSSLSDEEIDEDEDEPYEQLIVRDERRFKTADLDKDGHLDKDEFSAFLHPEEFEQMKDLVITETLEDIDKNGDGEIDVDEYIGDMYNPEDDYEEPDWLNSERQQFSEFRDKNKDGKMDRDEVAAWILPSDYDHADSEAKHLLFESDTNKDGKLTKDEIVDKYDLFVGSQATDFGEALARHDEF